MKMQLTLCIGQIQLTRYSQTSGFFFACILSEVCALLFIFAKVAQHGFAHLHGKISVGWLAFSLSGRSNCFHRVPVNP